MILTVTADAVTHLKQCLASYNRGFDYDNGDNPSVAVGVRIGVRGGGCNGFEYALSYVLGSLTSIDENDIPEEHGGVKVWVDQMSAMYLEGTIVDYEDSLLKKGFVFLNPHATRTCGCGKSFSA